MHRSHAREPHGDRAGVRGLQDGGLHQRLNHLFKTSGNRYLRRVQIENKKSFERALKAAHDDGKRDEVLKEVRKLLLRAYEESVDDPRVLRHVRHEVGAELKRLMKEKES